jgi:hypothetical protein
MPTSQLFIVRITREPRRFVAWARRIDEEACGEFVQPQQLLNFLLGRPNNARAAGNEAQPPEQPRHGEP